LSFGGRVRSVWRPGIVPVAGRRSSGDDARHPAAHTQLNNGRW